MNNQINIPYAAHEGTVARFERIIRRLWIVIIVLIIALVFLNAMWIYAWTSYDYISEVSESEANNSEVTVDGKDGVATYIGANNSGDIINGENNR